MRRMIFACSSGEFAVAIRFFNLMISSIMADCWGSVPEGGSVLVGGTTTTGGVVVIDRFASCRFNSSMRRMIFACSSGELVAAIRFFSLMICSIKTVWFGSPARDKLALEVELSVSAIKYGLFHSLKSEKSKGVVLISGRELAPEIGGLASIAIPATARLIIARHTAFADEIKVVIGFVLLIYSNR